MELGAISMMVYGLREREQILEIFEMVTDRRRRRRSGADRAVCGWADGPG
jgi:NADH:ubiquinone oxidoreductase subunit D